MSDEDEHARERDAAEMLARRKVDLSTVLDMSDTSGALKGKAGGEKGRYYEGTLFDRDASQPLVDRRWELYCCARAAGSVAHAAYHAHVSQRGTVKTAQQQASRLERRVEVRARLRWLIQQRQLAARLEATGAAVAGAAGPPAAEGAPLTRAEKVTICEAILRDRTVTVGDRIRAMEQHSKLLEASEREKKRSLADLDPAELMAYFRRAAEQGQDPEMGSQRAPHPQPVVVSAPARELTAGESGVS